MTKCKNGGIKLTKMKNFLVNDVTLATMNLVVHSIGNTRESIFALELVESNGSATIYYVDPVESTKHNRLFDPFKIGSPLETAIVELKADLDGKQIAINTSGLKLLSGDFPKAKKFTDKLAVELTTLQEYTPPVVETLYNFEQKEPTTCGNPDSRSKHNSCPFENSIVANNNVYIYTKPFSNFTKFCFDIDRFYYPTLEHLIMHLRLWTLVDEPIKALAEENPEDTYILSYLDEMGLEDVDDLLDQDPRELSYELIHKSIVNNWNTGIMKRCVVARTKRYHNLVNEHLVGLLVERTSTYYQHALNMKVLSSPSLTYFFLVHKDCNWYEVAPIDSVWVIEEHFLPELRDDEEYINRLEIAAGRDGIVKNAFGRYLQNTAVWLDEVSATTGISAAATGATTEDEPQD